MNTPSFKAGFVQFDVRLGEPETNLAAATRLIRQLGAEGARLAVLPEMWSCGFDNARLAEHARSTPELLDRIAGLAAAEKMLIAGSLPELLDGRVYNTLYLTGDDGRVLGAYRKVHLFTYNREDRYFAAGNAAVVCDTPLGPLGLMVCYDLRFPELCRTLTLRGAALVLVSAQWPAARIERWDILARARAIENQIYLLGSNRCGSEKGTMFNGHSVLIHPSGAILAQAVDGETAARSAAIDLNELKQVREEMPCLRERVPDAYAV